MQDAAQLIGKAEVEQPVGFVEHQHLHIAQTQRVVFDHVEQSARGGNHQIGAAAQKHQLWVDRDPAVQHGQLERLRQRPGQRAQRLANLHGQLAGGHQHQRADATRHVAALTGQPLQQGQGKGGGLA